MNRIILADEQPIFRAGVARMLAHEPDMRIVAHCEEPERLLAAIHLFRSAVVLVSSRLCDRTVLAQIEEARSQVIVIAEEGKNVPGDLLAQMAGVINRGTTEPELLKTIRDVARGQRRVSTPPARVTRAPDSAAQRVLNRLTPRELQIVSLITQGCKNRQIALRLGTKEQVVKNYLRSIYDKSGVKDRLELALFVLHHRVLAEAADKTGSLLQSKTA